MRENNVVVGEDRKARLNILTKLNKKLEKCNFKNKNKNCSKRWERKKKQREEEDFSQPINNLIQKLEKLTNISRFDISLIDEKVMFVFTNNDTEQIPNFDTKFRRMFLTILKPTSFSQLVRVFGISFGGGREERRCRSKYCPHWENSLWNYNQHTIYKSMELYFEELITCQEDIFELLDSCGVKEKSSLVFVEHIKNGKWIEIPLDGKREIAEKLRASKGDKETELYLSILSKIKEICSRQYAEEQVRKSWWIAFYKIYYPQQFEKEFSSWQSFYNSEKKKFEK